MTAASRGHASVAGIALRVAAPGAAIGARRAPEMPVSRSAKAHSINRPDVFRLDAVVKSVLGCVAAVFALAGVVLPAVAQDAAPNSGGPRFRADGPNADAYGRSAGYPRCEGLAYVAEQRCRVGALSHYDALFPSRSVPASTQPTALRRAPVEPLIRYAFAGQEWTLDQYLDRNPVTGLLIAKGDTILVERYQYGRTDADRLVSFSMAKSILGILIGIAVEEKTIRSVADMAEKYVPGLKGTAYGRTPIEALLRMQSGVTFNEDYADTSSDIYALARLTLEQDRGGSLAAVKRFNTRAAAPGKRFSYSSADTVVLGLVLAGATRQTLSAYTSSRLWQPLGAEAHAAWNIDATGQEIPFAYFNAVLRDWARLGLMLAHHGTWAGRTILPREWLAASAAGAVETGLAPLRYGYQTWISEDRKRLVLRGLRGQHVFVDPEIQLVLVQTALDSSVVSETELVALWTAARAQLR